MYIFRCTFILTEYDNLKSTIFVKALDEQTATEGSAIIFKETLVKHKLSLAKFEQEVKLSSEEEMSDYEHFIRNRDLPKKDLN
jgi:hypothetical protein